MKVLKDKKLDFSGDLISTGPIPRRLNCLQKVYKL